MRPREKKYPAQHLGGKNILQTRLLEKKNLAD